MNIIKDFENLINKEISNIIIEIISNNICLDISAKSRAGAEISEFLEN